MTLSIIERHGAGDPVMLADPPQRRSTTADSPLLAGTNRLRGARPPTPPLAHPRRAAHSRSPSGAGVGAGAGGGSPSRSGSGGGDATAGAATAAAAANSRAKRERDKSRKKKARKQRHTMSSMATSPEFTAALAAVEARDQDNLGSGADAGDVAALDAAEVTVSDTEAGADGTDADAGAAAAGGGTTTVVSSSVRLVQLVADLKRNIPGNATGAAAVLTDAVEGKLRELARLLEAKGDSARASTRNCVYLRVSGGLRTVVQCCTREAVAFSPRIVAYALRVVSAALATTASNRSYVMLTNLGVPLVEVLASALDQVVSSSDIDSLISQVRSLVVSLPCRVAAVPPLTSPCGCVATVCRRLWMCRCCPRPCTRCGSCFGTSHSRCRSARCAPLSLATASCPRSCPSSRASSRSSATLRRS